MASIHTETNGCRRVLVVCPDGERRSIRLGKSSKKQAEAFKHKVEELVASKLVSHPPDHATCRWVAGLDDVMHKRLAAVGLVTARQSSTLGSWLEKYLDIRSDLKPESLRKLEQTKAKLLAFFNADTAVRNLCADQAPDWRKFLVKQGLSVAAVKTHCGNAKTIFFEAVRRKLIDENPFGELSAGSTASTNDRYITPDETDKVIEVLPNARWRLLFGLARYAGLRIPSESCLLTCADVDFDRGVLTVRSPKTERYCGHQVRKVPICPKLMKLLQDRFDEMKPGEEILVTYRGGHVARTLQAAIERAGVERWDALFQSCRASCEQEWAISKKVPQGAASKWIGHSITVSGKHYLNGMPDEVYSLVTENGQNQAAQNAAQQAAESIRMDQKMKNPAEAGISHNPASTSTLAQVIAGSQLGGGGNRTPVPRLLEWRPLHA